MPMSAPGIRLLIRDANSVIAKTLTPMTRSSTLVEPSSCTTCQNRKTRLPLPSSTPSSTGSCPTMMCTEIAAKKPTVTGIESKSAIQPALAIPTTINTIPTASARRLASGA